MKATFYLRIFFALVLTNSLQSFGQITITSANMPVPGDTIRVSETNTLNIPDPSNTGFDFTWDYSILEPSSQNVLEFVNPNQTPFLYQIVFTPAVANLAMPVENLDFFEFEMTDSYEFYRNTNFLYDRAGYATSINGFPVPLKYDQPEILYRFPLSTSSEPDSSISQFEIQYQGIGYFHHYKKRVNEIDGSGTLITPYGTFNTIRQRSDILQIDSLFIDSIQMGVPVVRNYTEFKWLSPDYPVPLLTIISEAGTYSLQYIDSVRNVIPFLVNIGEDITICRGESVTLTASVQGGEPPYTYVWTTMQTTPSITVTPEDTTTYYVIVTDANQNITYDDMQVFVKPLDIINLGNDTTICAENEFSYTVTGVYDLISWFVNDQLVATGASYSIDTTGIGLSTIRLRIEYQQGTCTGIDEIILTFQICNSIPEIFREGIIVTPNPADDIVYIEGDHFLKPVIRINDINGKMVDNFSYHVLNKRISIDIGSFRKGIYTITLIDGTTIKTAKLVVR